MILNLISGLSVRLVHKLNQPTPSNGPHPISCRPNENLKAEIPQTCPHTGKQTLLPAFRFKLRLQLSLGLRRLAFGQKLYWQHSGPRKASGFTLLLLHSSPASKLPIHLAQLWNFLPSYLQWAYSLICGRRHTLTVVFPQSRPQILHFVLLPQTVTGCCLHFKAPACFFAHGLWFS